MQKSFLRKRKRLPQKIFYDKPARRAWRRSFYIGERSDGTITKIRLLF